MDGVSPALAIRSNVGVELWASTGLKEGSYKHTPELPKEETKNSRSISFSPEGQYFAYTNGQEIKVLRSSDWQPLCSLPRPKALYLKFSPKGNYLCTLELFAITKDKPDGAPNMFVYDLTNNGAEVFSIIQKKQTDWEPSWAADESLFAIVVGGEALFYDLTDGAIGFKTTSRKIGGSRNGVLSLGPGNSPPFLAFYVPGAKGAPSMCKLYKYPALGQNQTVACKSFFQADRVEILWNKRGTGLLLLTSTEVDKSGASYYGNQALHFMATKGDSCSVPLSKEGPVHCVKWSPKATEFVVVYGYMPSKAALYNLKCDVIFDFGEGPRNCAYFNSFGNLLVLAGFGNLPGNIEIWDISKKEQLTNIKVPDTTHFEWNPNGKYFLTATTAPRLRIGNGFKVYHYSGALMHETLWPEGQELLGVGWQQFPEKTFEEPIITKEKHEGIKSSQPEASKKAYTPPHLRLMKEGKNPDKYMPQLKAIPGQSSSAMSTNSGKPKGSKNNGGNSTQAGGGNGIRSRNAKNPRQNKGSTTDANKQNSDPAQNVDGGVNQQIDENKTNPSQKMENKGANPNANNKRRQHNGSRFNVKNGAFGNHVSGGSSDEVLSGNGAESGEGNEILHSEEQPWVTTGKKKNHQQVPNMPQPQNRQNKANHQQQQQQPQPQQQQQQQSQQKQEPNENDGVDGNLSNAHRSANHEKEKKIRSVAKKLSDIKKLKARLESGETLELNQINKINQEAKFLEELKALKLAN